MKKIGLLFALCLLTSSASAQTSSPASGSAAGARPNTGTDAPKPGGKVTVPEEKRKPVNIPKTSAVITIDGLVNEDAWKSAAVFRDFYQTGPGYNIEPSRPTEGYVMYDEHNMYIAFKCWDDKDKIRATIAKRDNVFGEDNVRVWLDTYNDQRRAYVLGFNPLGIQQDGIFTEGQGADFTPDIVMESKGVIQDWGWSVEVKIPFKSLRYTAGPGKLWGFNMARNIDRFNDEFDQWYPDDRDVSGFLVKFGKIAGLTDIKYEKTLELVPSVTLSETGERVRANEVATGRFVNHQIKKDIGLNLKYTFSPNVTLSAAINPDFAEIEADAPVVTANQRFPIFFDEKRPFFLEGKEIFDTPLAIFYTRTIIDPDIAVKLSGKINKTSFGLMATSDNGPGNYNERERTLNDQCKERLALHLSTTPCPLDEFLDKNAYLAVARIKQDFGSSNSIGYFGTARIFPQQRNLVNSIDGKFKFNPATTMKWQAVATYSKEHFYSPVKDADEYRTGKGLGYYWSLDYTKDTHGWFAEAVGRTRDFVSDAGFTRRTNTNQLFFAYRESTKSKPKARVIRWDFNQFSRYQFDWAGRLQYIFAGGNVNWQMQGSWFFNVESGLQYEKNYEEDGFGPKRNNLAINDPNRIEGAFTGAPTRGARSPYVNYNINKTVNKALSFYTGGNMAFGAFDYDFGSGSPRFPRVSPAYIWWSTKCANNPACPERNGIGLDPGPGRETNLWGGFTYKVANPLTTSLDYTYDKLVRNDTGLTAYATNIFTWRTRYQFNRFTFARVRWDYDTLSSRVAGQFLLGWNPNPGTAFYVGYNDTLRYNGFNPYTRDTSGAPLLEPGFQRSGRTFFIRASYLFRKSF